MTTPVKLVAASGSDDLIPELLEQVSAIYPELEMFVISEFRPPQGNWIPYHIGRTFQENLALCRATLSGRQVQLAAVLLQPRMPYWPMRFLVAMQSPLRTLFFNENLNHFSLRPHSWPTMARHLLWRLRNLLVWELSPGGATYTFFWRLGHPKAFRRPVFKLLSRAAGRLGSLRKALEPKVVYVQPATNLPDGFSVVIPSRDGRDLLERLLPNLEQELQSSSAEVIVSDNGSSDGTVDWLMHTWPGVTIEHSADPLSFAKAVNAGIRNARYRYTLLLNNDMTLYPGFFSALRKAFEEVPDLFCATAQIFFPEGQRREETGKAVMPRKAPDFPVTCEEPIPGEDLSYVLYGSGGCSLYDTGKLRALDMVREHYEPAYVEDLDLGYRAWQRGWPSVFVEGARVLHQHRATTSRFYKEEQLAFVLETNYLKFLAGSVGSPPLFRRLWYQAIERLNAKAAKDDPVAEKALLDAPRIGFHCAPVASPWDEELFLGLTSGSVAVFPGTRRSGRPVVLVAAPYMPFPLSHGGAVRMYNLMRGAAADFDQVLIAFCDELGTPPRELLDLCVEIVQVKRFGTHALPSTNRPDVVEEFDSSAFHAALRMLVRKWQPGVAQLEFTQMAQYASDCAPAKTILVEHDITLDLYQQLLAQGETWELKRQLARWDTFERKAWREADCIVTMSEKDRETVTFANRIVALGNGVDLARFQASTKTPDAARVLFIGSFAHLPNVLALDYFLREVWPLMQSANPTLHIISGSRPQYFLDMYADRVRPPLDQPGIELEGFVADVRPAYERATVVVAPLLASAGTNIKILEAMAMGKAIVSTSSGVNGLNVEPGRDVIVTDDPAGMAASILYLFENMLDRIRIEMEARKKVEREYSWDVIARQQAELYWELMNS